MSRGFILFAENQNGNDYVKMACVLAMTIKLSQNPELSNVSLITDDVVDEKYKSLFDHIIPIPWKNSNSATRFSTDHRWKIYHVSPYEKNISLDVDMLVLKDLTLYWEIFKNYKIYFTSKIKDYRGNHINNDFYRKAFTANNLPNFYSALHYFEKSDEAKEFYQWIELISNNWELFYGKYVSEFYPGRPSMDITSSLAAKILSETNSKFTNEKSDPITFVHMKSKLQGWKVSHDDWMSSVGVYFDRDCNLKIGNFQQTEVFHYTEKRFLTDKIIEKIEKKLGL